MAAPYDVLYRGTVTQLTDEGPLVSISALGQGADFGPCEVASSTPPAVGDRVLIGSVGGQVEDTVILGLLALDVPPTSVTWDNVSGKPDTYPPSDHRQGWSTLDGVPSQFPPAPHLVTLLSDSTAHGRSLIRSTDAAFSRGLLNLDQVQNTSDLGKPVSTAQQAAITAAIQQAQGFGPYTLNLQSNPSFDLWEGANTPARWETFWRDGNPVVSKHVDTPRSGTAAARVSMLAGESQRLFGKDVMRVVVGTPIWIEAWVRRVSGTITVDVGLDLGNGVDLQPFGANRLEAAYLGPVQDATGTVYQRYGRWATPANQGSTYAIVCVAVAAVGGAASCDVEDVLVMPVAQPAGVTNLLSARLDAIEDPNYEGEFRATGTATISTTSNTDVPGCTWTFTAPRTMTFDLVADFDVSKSNATAGTFVGVLIVDGVEQTKQAIRGTAVSGDRSSVPRHHRVTVAAGQHTLKLAARTTVAGGNFAANATHTAMMVTRVR